MYKQLCNININNNNSSVPRISLILWTFTFQINKLINDKKLKSLQVCIRKTARKQVFITVAYISEGGNNTSPLLNFLRVYLFLNYGLLIIDASCIIITFISGEHFFQTFQ